MNIKPKINIIGLSGNAGAGKDEFCQCSIRILSMNGIKCVRISIGDIVKYELQEFIKNQFQFDIMNCERWQKEIVRGIIVEFGKAKRNISNGTYFIKKIESLIQILHHKNNINHFIVTDIRYCDDRFKLNDELWWIKNKMQGKMVYIDRYDNNNNKKVFVPPANDTEAYFHPLLKENADSIVEWESVENQTYRDSFANSILKNFEWI